MCLTCTTVSQAAAGQEVCQTSSAASEPSIVVQSNCKRFSNIPDIACAPLNLVWWYTCKLIIMLCLVIKVGVEARCCHRRDLLSFLQLRWRQQTRGRWMLWIATTKPGLQCANAGLCSHVQCPEPYEHHTALTLTHLVVIAHIWEGIILVWPTNKAAP